MARVMMLVSEGGATLAETRVGNGPDEAQRSMLAMRAEAILSGFSEDEVRAAKVVVVGAF